MTSAPGIDALNEQFEIPGVAKFAPGKGSLPFLSIKTSIAEGNIYLHGAQVTHYQPVGQGPVLFLSDKSYFRADKPIRGGIPLIFPWFGQRQHDPKAPMHGFARVQAWAVDSLTQNPETGDVTASFRMDDRIAVDSQWPFQFELIYRVTIGASLGLSLLVRSESSFQYEAALHSYFAVSDVRQVSVGGLKSLPYLDKTDNMKRKIQTDAVLQPREQTDRIYLSATGRTVTLDDPAAHRRVRVESSNAGATVVWNPWDAKARTMADLDSGEWPKMLCIETANVGEHAVALPPGMTHEMRARITSELIA